MKERYQLETSDSYIAQNSMATRQQIILRVGIIGGALLIILVVVIMVRNLSIVRQSASEVEQRERMMQIVNGSVSFCDDDPYPSVCRKRLVNTKAREFGSSDMCEVLQNEERASCVYDVIRETLDINDCTPLDGDDHDVCRDRVIRLSAQDKLDLALCSGIADDNERSTCHRITTDMIVSSGRCIELGVDPDLCEINATIIRAKHNLDPDVCNDLQADNKERCIDEVRSAVQEDRFFSDDEPEPLEPDNGTLDSDFDGISNNDERTLYGTDPYNPDTDNDGYSDKTEIDSGFNPLGSG